MKDFLRRNSATILTCVGAVGVVATSISAVKATPKASALLEKARKEKGEELTKLEKVINSFPAYIPTIITGTATIACIFGANIINKRTQATLMSAYALLDNSYREYKKKTDELYGEDAGKHIREEIAKDHYTGDDSLKDDDKELYYDFYSGRYFRSTPELVQWAEYETNRAMSVNGGVGLNEFYCFLGIEELPEYEDVGWSYGHMEAAYWHPWIEFDHEQTTIDDDMDDNGGLECTIVYMPFEPFMGFRDEI